MPVLRGSIPSHLPSPMDDRPWMSRFLSIDVDCLGRNQTASQKFR